MPKLIFSTCSQLVSIDQISNNLSIYHIVEELSSSQFPFQFPRIFVTSLWQRYEDEKNVIFELRIRFINPKNESKKEWKTEWQFERLRHRHILSAVNLPFDIPGIYAFETCIRKKGERVWSKPVDQIPLPVKKSSKKKTS